MTAMAIDHRTSLKAPVTLSVGLHVLAAAALLLAREAPRAPAIPTYRVTLLAAPPGERRIGTVAKPAAVAPKVSAPVPPPMLRSKTRGAPAVVPPAAKAAPIPAGKRAPVPAPTAVAPAAKAPPATAAGGGPEGGRGSDVANVKVDGIQFPYPAYLENITRHIALQFRPTARGQLTAEVAFLVRRDGTIAGLRLTRRSSVYSFDQDALAAVELAAKSFGPLPSGFADDVLPVIFSFDPRLIR